MLTDEVRVRLTAQISALGVRVHEAADLAELLRQKALPQANAAAYVLPLGLRPRGEGDASVNAFTQMVDEIVGVVLAVRSAGEASGAKALVKLDTLIDAVIAALSGWAPGAEVGVFHLSRGFIYPMGAGTVFYQLDFSIQKQVRILT
jgi:hypothetical protein